MIIGGGAVGMNAAFIAIGMEADVFVYDVSIDKLRELDIAFGGRASTVFSSTLSIEERLPDMDLVIGGGARARRPRPARDHAASSSALMKPQRGPRRRRDRPGRLLRDLAADDPRRPDLRGRRDHPLLRHQHAGRGADHLDLRADQRDASLRARARRPRRRRGGAPRPRPEARDQRRRAARSRTRRSPRAWGWTTRRPSRCSTSAPARSTGSDGAGATASHAIPGAH